MASLDISDPDITKYIKLVQDGNPANRWIVFSYVPKSNNKIKFCDSGSGDLKELREELDDSSIRFAYIRFVINNMPKFVYIPWCGDGVNGPIKGAFSGHAIEFSKSFKPIHHQVNARSEEDIDEKAITAALNKATGASYDSGSKVQGATKGTFIPQSVSQGREAATKSNAEVKNVINKNDYNKIQESAEYWKQNQANKSEPAKPTRPEYNLSTERDDYWKQQQAEKQKQQQQQQQQASKVNAPPPSRTVGNKFQEQVSKPTETAPPQPRPAPSKGSVLNRFPAATQQEPPAPSRPAAPVPSRVNKPAAPVQPVYQEPVHEEPQYEEPQYEEQQQQQQQQYEEQPTEEQQYYQEEQQYEEQPTEDQQYYQEEQQQYEQPTEEQQYYQEEQQQYEQPTEDQQYYQEEQQQYEQPAEEQYDQSGYLQAKALYDYNGENEGDLSFREGDIITILDQSDPDGWWQGSLPTGEQGFFPSNFVQQL
ncbi:hypothetical protein ACTFIY_008973 [Dictyostelium cf. discoideum]